MDFRITDEATNLKVEGAADGKSGNFSTFAEITKEDSSIQFYGKITNAEKVKVIDYLFTEGMDAGDGKRVYSALPQYAAL